MPTLVQPGDILPARRLPPLSGGAAVPVGAHRSRSQVLVVTHPEACDGCASYLATFAGVLDRVRTEKGDVLALVGAAWGEAPAPPVPALLDDGTGARLLSPAGTPVVAVADRFGQLFARYDAGTGHDFPTHDAVLTTLLDIAISCPECGVPDVPCLTTLPEPGATSGGIRLG